MAKINVFGGLLRHVLGSPPRYFHHWNYVVVQFEQCLCRARASGQGGRPESWVCPREASVWAPSQLSPCGNLTVRLRFRSRRQKPGRPVFKACDGVWRPEKGRLDNVTERSGRRASVLHSDASSDGLCSPDVPTCVHVRTRSLAHVNTRQNFVWQWHRSVVTCICVCM